MSDLSSYLKSDVPIVTRMRAAADANLGSGELDWLLGEFANEVAGWGENLRENADEAHEALESCSYGVEDLDSAWRSLSDVATALIGEDEGAEKILESLPALTARKRPSSEPSEFLNKLETFLDDSDVLLRLRNGSTASGTLVAIESGTVRLNHQRGCSYIRIRDISGIDVHTTD